MTTRTLPSDHTGLRSSVRRVLSSVLSAGLIAAATLTGTVAHAHGGDPVDASAASSLSLSLPVAMVASAPVAILAGGVVLTVVAVQASATGAVWVLERASDGARVVLRFSGQVVHGASAAVGASVMVTAISAGVLLSAAGELLCFVPNQIGASLLHNERIAY
jgi:hypothetical protein